MRKFIIKWLAGAREKTAISMAVLSALAVISVVLSDGVFLDHWYNKVLLGGIVAVFGGVIYLQVFKLTPEEEEKLK